jgi:hypothetical protein
MIHIAFIGNCQTVSLCFFLQELLSENNNYIVKWCLYGDQFKTHIAKWSEKCKNKIIDYNQSLEYIKICDYIIYQEISLEKSFFSNEDMLTKIKKIDCKLIKMSSICLDHSSYKSSLEEMIRRENLKNVDLKITQIIDKNKPRTLMLTTHHPNTYFFLEIIKEICKILNIEFFSQRKYRKYLNNPNYMELPYKF